MNDAAILEQINTLARRELGWKGSVEPQMRLVEDLRLDSIRLLTLAMAVEDQFQICLDEEDEASIVTVADMVSLIRSKMERDEGDEGA